MTDNNQTPTEEVTLGLNITTEMEVRTINGWKRVTTVHPSGEWFMFEGSSWQNSTHTFYVARPAPIEEVDPRVQAMKEIISHIHIKWANKTSRAMASANLNQLNEMAEGYKQELAEFMTQTCDEWAAQEVAKAGNKSLDGQRVENIALDAMHSRLRGMAFGVFREDASTIPEIAREIASRITMGEANL